MKVDFDGLWPDEQQPHSLRSESAKRPASRTTHAAHIQPNKVTLQASTTSSRYTRPDSAASNKSTGTHKPPPSTEHVTSRPIATARARRQGSHVEPDTRGGFDTRGLRRYKSDEQARSRSPSRNALAGQQQQQPSVPVRVFGASKDAAAAQPLAFGAHRMRPPVSPANQQKPLPVSRAPSRAGSVRGGNVLAGNGQSHSRAPSAESTTPRTMYAGGSNVGRTVRTGIAANASSAASASTTPVRQPIARPPPSPSAVSSAGNARTRASRIPRLAGYVESEAAAESRRRLLEENRVLSQQLAVEQNSNNELLKDFKDMASAFQATTLQLEEARSERAAAEKRVLALETELDEQREAGVELQKKLKAMEALLHAQELERSSARGLPSPNASLGKQAATIAHDTEGDDDDWQVQLERTQARVAEGHAVLMLHLPDSEIDQETLAGLNALESFVDRKGRNGEEDVVSRQFVQKRTPQQRRVVEEEERAKRRRSTMLFAGLIEPSSGSRSLLNDDDDDNDNDNDNDDQPSANMPSCARCAQLLDTMQLLEVDNDYYREANAKLRDNITDVVSRHNALVRFFEKERQQRRDAKALALAEATRAAAHERAMIEAQQRARLEALSAEDSELSSQFDRTLRIATRG
ncbi:hypothetical protein LPJ64_000775 [Coemansia asiatica]|uniref:Uncharacterized protein n=1 Tax=Coemansia asiatica TaxID=1052880 RepID=A0A9W7XQX5_9FUNG|nr:hypothetical protein LPJ64_000775 [Coemansia asiatica]